MAGGAFGSTLADLPFECKPAEASGEGPLADSGGRRSLRGLEWLLGPEGQPPAGKSVRFRVSLSGFGVVSSPESANFSPMGWKQTVAAPVEGVRRYGRHASKGGANFGYCIVCDHRTLFVETGPYLANTYRCVRCHSIPRWRGLLYVLNREFPNWRNLTLHECGSGGPASRKLRREAAGYNASRYLLPEVARGVAVGDITCQDLESLTFPDESFDLVITQDVLEHVLRPEQAVAEIARVLRPGGAHVFTVPIVHGGQTVVRAIPSESGIEHILAPDYHGDSLVIREWGDDFVSFVSDHTGGSDTEICRLHDRKLGLDGDPLEVFITRKKNRPDGEHGR